MNCCHCSHPPLLETRVREYWGTHKISSQNIPTLSFTNGGHTFPAPWLAACQICLWKVTPSFPKYSAQGHIQRRCWLFFFTEKRKMRRLFKAEPRRKSSSLVSRGSGPKYQVALTEVLNMGKAHVLFLIIISNLKFGFLVRAYFGIPL